MQIILGLWELIAGTGAWWLVFAAIAFFIARYAYWWCVPVGHSIVGAILLVVDAMWAAEVRRSMGLGAPDIEDFYVFLFWVLIHVLLVNTLLLPITWLGGRGRKAYRRPLPKQYDILP